MLSPLEEIKKIRAGRIESVLGTNRNIYSILIPEHDGSVTSYAFTSPIYDARNGRLVKCQFLQEDNGYRCLEAVPRRWLWQTVSLWRELTELQSEWQTELYPATPIPWHFQVSALRRP